MTVGRGNDTVQLGNGSDNIVTVGGGGNDTVQLGNGSDNIVTVGGGNDTVQLGNGSDITDAGRRSRQL